MKLEWVAGIASERMAGFIGIRKPQTITSIGMRNGLMSVKLHDSWYYVKRPLSKGLCQPFDHLRLQKTQPSTALMFSTARRFIRS